jgi:hypothetical protein
MAAPVALNAMFVRLGFSAAAATILADEDQENLSIDALLYFDDKGIQTLCATLRKPGGQIAGPAPAGGGAIPMIPNPGVYVSTIAELNLKVVCFMAKHYVRTSRTLMPAMVTMAKVQQYAQYKEAEKDYKEPDDALKLSKPDKIIDFIEEWPESLALYNGQNARPLSYVIREVIAVPAEGTDPTFGEPWSVYSSLRDEIAARADHGAHQYFIDNARVFELLNEAVHEHKHVKTWIKPFATTRDGRSAWLAFKAHYRGSSELEAIETAAEHRLDTLIYRGEKPRYNFETHVTKHRQSHLELQKATGHEMAGTTKVRRLLKSLQATTMQVPVATIRATENLKIDFDATVNYLRNFINTIDQETRTVAPMASKGGGNRGGGGPGKKGTGKHSGKNKYEDKTIRFYDKAEWKKLDADEKARIIAARDKRKIASTSTGTEQSNNKRVTFEEDKDNASDTSNETNQRSSKKQKKSSK